MSAQRGDVGFANALVDRRGIVYTARARIGYVDKCDRAGRPVRTWRAIDNYGRLVTAEKRTRREAVDALVRWCTR